MRRWRALQIVGLLTVMVAPGLRAADDRIASFPEPNIVQNSWELGVKFKQPAIISVRLADQEKPKLYYFVTYTVTNLTGEDQLFVPDVSALTDAGDLVRVNRAIPPAVFKAIKERLRNPLL